MCLPARIKILQTFCVETRMVGFFSSFWEGDDSTIVRHVDCLIVEFPDSIFLCLFMVVELQFLLFHFPVFFVGSSVLLELFCIL